MKKQLDLIPKFILLLFLFSVWNGCARPRIAHTSAETVRNFTVFNNYAHQTYQAVGIADSLKISAQEHINGSPVGSLIEYGDYLLFNTANGYLYSAKKTDPTNFTNTRLGKGCASSPTLKNGKVYFPLIKGKYGLIEYDLQTAKTVWELRGNLSASAPVILQGLIIHAANNGKITAFNAKDHAEVWSIQSGNKISNNIAASDSQLYICGRNGQIQSYAIRDGSLQWSTRTQDHFYASPFLNASILYAFSFDGIIYKIDAKTGQVLKQVRMGAPIYKMGAMDNKNLYVGATNGTLTAYSLADLRKRWQVKIDGPPSASPIAIKDEIIVATAARKLYRMSSRTGQIQQTIRLEHPATTTPLFIEDKFIFGSQTPAVIVLQVGGDSQ